MVGGIAARHMARDGSQGPVGRVSWAIRSCAPGAPGAVMTTMQAHFPNSARPYLKTVAAGLLAIPALLLTALAIGEMAGGDMAGAQHVPGALVLVVLAAAAWKYPTSAGVILMVAGTVLFALWALIALTADRHDSPASMVMVAVVLFVPPLVAGWLLYSVGRS